VDSRVLTDHVIVIRVNDLNYAAYLEENPNWFGFGRNTMHALKHLIEAFCMSGYSNLELRHVTYDLRPPCERDRVVPSRFESAYYTGIIDSDGRWVHAH